MLDHMYYIIQPRFIDIHLTLHLRCDLIFSCRLKLNFSKSYRVAVYELL